ncbi:MAG: M20/M25/M40 family metallo-hydrolase [Solirubrobacterales bacterium]|nr:M20/M25/M40 family metallo-hydrolase [Solirubrobacterales bacterium]
MGDLQQEATELLRELIRFNTVNPPGNERAAQEWLGARFTEAGFEVELIGAEPERPNLIARLRGDGPGPTLCLSSHVDTVLASAREWTHDPWSGDLADGFVWGRGALDMKSQTACEAAAALSLARGGWRPKGELLVVVLVDEETGGALGAQWITREHPDKVRCDLFLNEGGGKVIEYDGRRLYPLGCGEKGVFRFSVITEGVAGHASIPKIGVNALLKMGPVLDRLGASQPSYDLTEDARALLVALTDGGEVGQFDATVALDRVRSIDSELAIIVEAMLGVTLTPTRIRASEKVNVIPSQAVLEVDCRVPPGLGEEQARVRIEEVLGSDGHRIEFINQVVGNRSPFVTTFSAAIGDWLGEQDPGCEVVPFVLPGFTDSRYFRAAFPDLVAYGFFPHRHMTMGEASPLIHSADERIDVRDLGFAATFFRDISLRMLS